MAVTIPQHFYADRHWRSVLYLFREHRKLNQYFTTKYFDFEAGTIEITALKRVAKVWSNSEKIMLALALNCFNERNKFNLGDIDYLDAHNKDLAFQALRIRYM